MNIYSALEKDHAELNKLLDKLVACSEADQTEKWKLLIDQIADELIPHSPAEEAAFYNAIRELKNDHRVINHSYTEHAMAEGDLRALQAMKAIDVNWTQLAKKLRKDLHHHIRAEEGRVFDMGKQLFTEEEAKMIGSAFTHLKETVKQQSVIGTTLDLISNLLPRRLVPGFVKSISNRERRSA